MYTTLVRYESGFVETYHQVNRIRVTPDELILFIDHVPITVDLSTIDAFEVTRRGTTNATQ